MGRALQLLLLVFIAAAFVLPQVAAGPQGVIVVDSFGRVVPIPEKPARIVSLAPSITETLFAMGLGDRVVGVTSFCNYPPEVPRLVKEGRIEVVGNFIEPSLEKVVALKPDLVFAHNLLSPEFVKKLEDLGVPVVAIRTPESVAEVYQVVMLIGRASWEEGRAADLAASMISKIQFWGRLVEDVTRIDVAYVVSYEPIWVAGSGTYIHDLIGLAGGENAFADKNWWFSISLEEFVARNPRILITSDEAVYEALIALRERGLIRSEVKLVSEDPINRPGPRIAYALEELVNAIHPEIWARVVEATDLRAPSEAIVGQPFEVIVGARNPGLLGGVKRVELEFGGKTYSKDIYLGAGEAEVVEFRVSAEKPGAYLLRFRDRYAACYVREAGEGAVIEEATSARAVFEELAAIKSSLDSLKGEVKALNAAVGNAFGGLHGELMSLGVLIRDVERLSTGLMAISLATAALLVALIFMIKVRRRGDV